MEMLEFYLKSQAHKVISRDLSLDMLSHAYILECPDDVITKAYSMLMAKEIYCAGESNKPCCACNYCNKIEHGNLVDLKIYPKEKSIVVDDILEIVGDSLERPMDSNYKVYILHDFDLATTQAQNKILKTLEEPPKGVIFILTCSSSNAVLQTILSRVKRISEPVLSISDVTQYLASMGVKNSDKVACVSGGNLSTANRVSGMSDVGDVINLAIDILLNLRSSSDILKYSSKIVALKKDFPLLIDTMISILRDVCAVGSVGVNFVGYEKYLSAIKAIISPNACVDIVGNLCEIYNKLDFNCNIVGVVDKMLLDILEVKFLCQK